MVNPAKRMRVLRELLWLKTGPGALILPREVTKISMQFNRKIEGGHRGARKFWREMLPKVKFRNPAIPIEITRHQDRQGPSILNIYTAAADRPLPTPSKTAPAPPASSPNAANTLTPDTTKPTHSIDIRLMSEHDILGQLISKTGATVLEQTPEEVRQWKETLEAKHKSEMDRQEVRAKFLKERHEQQLMKIARGKAS